MWMTRKTEPEITIRGSHFVDGAGRRVTLRGVNLGGSNKVPAVPNGATHIADTFFETMATASFVNRPFPLSEADGHFRRMRAWGFNVLRLVITWEAIEHDGPGLYDKAYLRYLTDLVTKAGAYGMSIYIDPHQDVWSRFSGGDGAPAWTFEKVGLDVRAFGSTGAALVHQTYPGGPEQFPRMTWPTNLHKLACATMFTIFWAGNTFAPKLAIDGEGAQSYLQRHYIGAMAQVALAVRRCPNVLGFGTMNEPLPGYIGIKHLGKLSGPLRNGVMPTPFEGMAVGSGHALKVGVYSITDLRTLVAGLPVRRERIGGTTRAWLPGHQCVWQKHGVWDEDPSGVPKLLKPDYFKGVVDFGKDCYLPFAADYQRAMRAAMGREPMLFIEMPPADLGLADFPTVDVEALGGAVVHAPHWYDQLTLFFGRYIAWASLDVQHGGVALGRRAVAGMHQRQLALTKEEARDKVGGAPTLIGEIGIPFDLNGRKAYAGGNDPTKGSLEPATAALAASVAAMEANELSFTLWCYAADHTPEWGDQWNKEDLSIFSASASPELEPTADPAGVFAGGRAQRAFARPYVRALAGSTIKAPSFDPATRRFTVVFEHDASVSAPSVIFVPAAVQYADGFQVIVSDGDFECVGTPANEGGYVLVEFRHSAAQSVHSVTIEPAAKASAAEQPATPLLQQ